MQRSDEERYTEFVRAHSASLFRTGYLLTGDYQRAEDLLQSTLVRLYHVGPGSRPWSGRWAMHARSW